MKKLSLALALASGGLLACSLMVNAQDAKESKGEKRGGFSVEQRLERMTTELKLTDAQKPKVKAVLEEGQKKRGEMRDVPQEERRGKMQAFMEEQNKKMKEILTPEQWEKYSKMQEEMRKKGPGGGKKKSE